MALDDGSTCPYLQNRESPCFKNACIADPVSVACREYSVEYCEIELEKLKKGQYFDPQCSPPIQVDVNCAFKTRSGEYSSVCSIPKCANDPTSKDCRTHILDHCESEKGLDDLGCNFHLHNASNESFCSLPIFNNVTRCGERIPSATCAFDSTRQDSPCHHLACRGGGNEDVDCRTYIAVYCKKLVDDPGCQLITDSANVNVHLDCDFEIDRHNTPCGTKACRASGKQPSTACRTEIKTYCKDMDPASGTWDNSCELGKVDRVVGACSFDAASKSNPCESDECRGSYDNNFRGEISILAHPQVECRGKIREHCGEIFLNTAAPTISDMKGCNFGQITTRTVTTSRLITINSTSVEEVEYIENRIADGAVRKDLGSLIILEISQIRILAHVATVTHKERDGESLVVGDVVNISGYGNDGRYSLNGLYTVRSSSTTSFEATFDHVDRDTATSIVAHAKCDKRKNISIGNLIELSIETIAVSGNIVTFTHADVGLPRLVGGREVNVSEIVVVKKNRTGQKYLEPETYRRRRN